MNRHRFYIGVALVQFVAKAHEVTTLPDGFTAYRAVGFWQGHFEETTVLEVVGEVSAFLPLDLATVFEQDAILVTTETIQSQLVCRAGTP